MGAWVETLAYVDVSDESWIILASSCVTAF